MEQSTTILNSSILLYSAPWSLILIKFKCSNVLLHKALFYSNFEILWKLWNFWNFWKFYHFEFFEILWKFWNFMKILKLKKKYGNFKKFLKFWIFFYNFEFLFFFILWNFLTLISKKQFLCNKKPYCTLVPHNFIHWFCTRVQYDFLLHRIFFLLINMLGNGISRVLLLANGKTVK
jgi:hypothetical protein